jgi:hypothetical protein
MFPWSLFPLSPENLKDKELETVWEPEGMEDSRKTKPSNSTDQAHKNSQTQISKQRDYTVACIIGFQLSSIRILSLCPLVSLAKGLSILLIFSKNQLLVWLMLWIVLLVSTWLIEISFSKRYFNLTIVKKMKIDHNICIHTLQYTFFKIPFIS